MARREKPWDCAMSSETGNLVRKRRMNPDGVERQVKQKTTRAGLRYVFPWGELEDGDFFIVPTPKEGSRQSMLVGFRQAAARHDIEISVAVWDREGEECFRVIRVIGGIRKIKAAARQRGAFAPASDVEAYYARQAARRRGDGGSMPAATSIAPTPPEASPVATDAALTAPLGTDAERRYDREQLLAERRRAAARELAGMDPDDEDVMGVEDGAEV
jgi:hypothetical protein